MRRLFIIFVLIFCTACAPKLNDLAEFYKETNLTPICRYPPYDLCGFADTKKLELYQKTKFILPPVYEHAFEFHNELAAVKIDGQYGYINPIGEIVIAPQFDLAGGFDQGLAIVEEDGLLGVINRRGEMVVTPQFGEALVLNRHTLIARMDRNIHPSNLRSLLSIDPRGDGFYRRELVNTIGSKSPSYNYPAGRLYDIRSGWIGGPDVEYDFTVFDRDNRDFIWASIREGLPIYMKTWGLMRTDSSWQIPPQFSSVGELQNGFARVKEDKITGRVDANGNLELPIPVYQSFAGKFGKVYDLTYKQAQKQRKSRMEGIIDQSGSLVGGRYFRKVAISGDRAAGARANFKKGGFSVSERARYIWSYYDENGTLIRDDLLAFCPDYVLVPDGENEMIVQNHKGEKIHEYKFVARWGNDHLFDRRGADVVGALTRSCKKPSGVKTVDGKVGTLLPNGTLVGDRLFDKVIWPGRTTQWVLENGQWGLMDLEGEYLLEPSYDDIKDSGQWYVEARQGDKLYYLSQWRWWQKGETSLKRYESPDVDYQSKDRVGHGCPYPNWKRGSMIRSRNGLWGMVDGDENVIVPFKYEALSCFAQGIAWAPHSDKKQWCPIGQNGEFDLNRRCKLTHYFQKPGTDPSIFRRMTILPKRFHNDPFRSSVLWMQESLNNSEGNGQPNTGEQLDQMWLNLGSGIPKRPEHVTIPFDHRPSKIGEALK